VDSAPLDSAPLDSAFYRDLSWQLTGQAGAAALTGEVTSNPACGGPWHPDLQHGGPPNALLVLAAERLAAAAAGRSDLQAVRLAAEFLGPVPVAPLALTANVDRLSRTAALVSATLAGPDGRTCLQARIWLLAPGERPAVAGVRSSEVGPDPAGWPSLDFDGFPYARHLRWHGVVGSPTQLGPAAAWIAARIPLVAGETYTALQRTALFADSASGISAELSWDEWSFANVDLDLHLFQPAIGDWLLVDAVTELGDGMALTRSRLSDRTGPVGAGMQTLLVRRHQRRLLAE